MPVNKIIPFLTSLLVLTNAAPTISSRGSVGCGKDLPAAQQPAGGASHQVSFTPADGTARTYLIHIPSNYNINTPVSVIFSFHGRTKDSAEQEALSQFSNESWNPNAIAVYPQGLDNQWQGDPASTGVNDISFVSDMLDHFEERYCIDSTRIYAAGKSNGGGFTGTLACDATMSKRIAAFAPISAALYVPGSTETDCAPQTISLPCQAGRTNVPILEMHGTADTTIPYAGGPRRGECLPTIPHYVREWAKRDLLGIANTTTELYGGKVHKYQYGSGLSFGLITHYLTEGLGHAWPSIQPNDDNSAGTYFDATPVIMDFFAKYTT